MQKLKIILTIISINLSLYGQSRKITLIIDTLEDSDYNFKVATRNTNNLALGIAEFIEDSLTYRQYNKYPNFYCPIIIKSDSSSIQLTLDNDDGYVSLHNVYNAKSDTIRLSKYVVYDNCNNDTIYTTTTYYHKKINEPLGKPYKIKHNKSITKANCKKKIPLNVKYNINNENYNGMVLKEIEGGVYISDFHGYQPNEYNLKPETYKGKVTYFHGHSETKSYINIVSLKIKNGL